MVRVMICRSPHGPLGTVETHWEVRYTIKFSASLYTDTHDLGPLLSVRVHSSTQGVIGVKIEHFSVRQQYPHIPLFPDVPPVKDVSLKQTESIYSLTTGGLTAEITEKPYTITFKSPTRILTFAGEKHQALFDVPSRWTLSSASNSSCLALDPASNPNPAPLPPVVRYINSELNLSPGELVYGFGEQFGAFVKNGRSI
jgi:hypothetical protein